MRFVLFYIVTCVSISLALGVAIYPILEAPPAQESSRQSYRPQAARMEGKTSRLMACATASPCLQEPTSVNPSDAFRFRRPVFVPAPLRIPLLGSPARREL
ncbi:hypothetical protein CWR43_36290 [Rhizobium sullae]|uniref:Uncharacterized protein n=1 Tax=Rhizobium sullae TaxID=50338 RepID=A0A2N0CY73_RHISU|nr:hypothetical protein CWR43_36290 [Rhizobium sullae]